MTGTKKEIFFPFGGCFGGCHCLFVCLFLIMFHLKYLMKLFSYLDSFHNHCNGEWTKMLVQKSLIVEHTGTA